MLVLTAPVRSQVSSAQYGVHVLCWPKPAQTTVQPSSQSTAKELLNLAYPMVISQGAFAVMIFTDRFFMSLVSPTHMAASLGGGVASFFCMSLFIYVIVV